jgi:hypothetical protein
VRVSNATKCAMVCTSGGVAERFKASRLKREVGKPTGGSNPSASAKQGAQYDGVLRDYVLRESGGIRSRCELFYGTECSEESKNSHNGYRTCNVRIPPPPHSRPQKHFCNFVGNGVASSTTRLFFPAILFACIYRNDVTCVYTTICT